MPYQFSDFYEYQYDFLADETLLRVVNKSRQIGFSEVIAFEGFLEASKESTPAEPVLYISAGERQAKELLDKVRWWVSEHGVRDVDLAVNSQSELRLPNGTPIISLPSNPETVRGYTPRRIYIDEAAHIRNLKDLLSALGPSLSRKDRRRFLTLTSTPRGKQGMFYDIVQQAVAGEGGWAYHEIDIDKAIRMGCPQDKEACRRLVPDEQTFEQEYMCAFVDESFAYFPWALIDTCIDEVLSEQWRQMGRQLKGGSGSSLCDAKQLPNEGRRKVLYAGYDPAKRVDGGVFTVGEQRGNGLFLVDGFEYTSRDYQYQVSDISDYCRKVGITKLRMDATGPGEAVYEMLTRELGSMVEPIKFSTQMKEKLITDLRVLMQDNKMKLPDHERLKQQLHSLERSYTETGKVRYQHQKKSGHDDWVWSLAMMAQGCIMPSRFITKENMRFGSDFVMASQSW